MVFNTYKEENLSLNYKQKDGSFQASKEVLSCNRIQLDSDPVYLGRSDPNKSFIVQRKRQRCPTLIEVTQRENSGLQVPFTLREEFQSQRFGDPKTRFIISLKGIPTICNYGALIHNYTFKFEAPLGPN
jgi:hypothetical protein